MATKNNTNELHLTRIYEAPVKAVWDAWVEPDQVAQWWGPRGFTITTHSKDVRTGGHWNYIMHGPDGVDYPNKTKYLEVEKYSRLVYDHGANDHQPPLFRVTVLFSESQGKTTMNMTMTLATAEAAQEIKKFIKKAGGESTWDRLGEYLSEKLNSKAQFIINRTFEAPIETIFDMWTKPEHLSKWLAPTGFEMTFLKSEIKQGSQTFYMMTDGKNTKMYGKANYLEIVRPHRLVYTQIFCDEHENISRHPMAPTWPETMLTTITFTAESSEQTRITINWEVYGNASDIERSTFNKAKAGMTMGWTGSFDKLEEYLLKNI